MEVLGIFADNPDDRRRYAKLYAAQQRELLDRIAAFEADYLEEYAALNQPVVCRTREDRSKLVIAIDCDSTECRRQIAEAIAIAQNGAVDMYVVGSVGNDAAVRIWAATNKIPPDLGPPASNNPQPCQTGHETRVTSVIAHPSPTATATGRADGGL